MAPIQSVHTDVHSVDESMASMTRLLGFRAYFVIRQLYDLDKLFNLSVLIFLNGEIQIIITHIHEIIVKLK